MKLLALDTSTGVCSVALWLDGEIQSRELQAERTHAEAVLTLVDELLDESGTALGRLDAVAFGRGPGAFTGVRVAVSVAQGLAFGVDIPVVPISDLAAVAQAAFLRHGESQVIACLDARMSEVYAGAYLVSVAGCELVGEEAVQSPDALGLPGTGRWFGAGSGFAVYGDKLQSRLGSRLAGRDAEIVPQARDIAALAAIAFQRGEALSVEQALPVYLRDRVAVAKT